MIAFEAETKVLDTEIFLHHAIIDLNSGITFIEGFIQEKPLRCKEINTHSSSFATDHWCFARHLFRVIVIKPFFSQENLCGFAFHETAFRILQETLIETLEVKFR